MKRQSEAALKRRILSLVKAYYQLHKRSSSGYRIQYGGRSYDEREMASLVDAALEFWVTYGWRAQRFEKELARYLGLGHAVFVNSGSSANLLCVASLCSSLCEHQIGPGSEVIVPAATFPTTINPLILYGLRPVLVDSKVGTYNVDSAQISRAITKKTRAIMLPHMLGNPANLDVITETAKKHDLFLVEDCCESLSAKYRGKFLGTAGDLATYSFYAPHHITTGEGGAVCTDDTQLYDIVVSLRDWGRGHELAGARELPKDYDSRFVYATRGYNFRPLDLEAAIGLVQLRKLPFFIRRRKANFARLYELFSRYKDFLVLPKSESHAQPAWFGFPLTVKQNPFFNRAKLVSWLEHHRIETRSIMAGNILHQPAYKDVRFRVVGKLPGADTIMRSSFFMGLYPEIGPNELKYIGDVVERFFEKFVPRKSSPK